MTFFSTTFTRYQKWLPLLQLGPPFNFFSFLVLRTFVQLSSYSHTRCRGLPVLVVAKYIFSLKSLHGKVHSHHHAHLENFDIAHACIEFSIHFNWRSRRAFFNDVSILSYYMRLLLYKQVTDSRDISTIFLIFWNANENFQTLIIISRMRK